MRYYTYIVQCVRLVHPVCVVVYACVFLSLLCYIVQALASCVCLWRRKRLPVRVRVQQVCVAAALSLRLACFIKPQLNSRPFAREAQGQGYI